MKQKEVKIIGLKINNQMGILQSCQLTFDPNNKLIVVKGEVGSGKSTLHKSIALGTQGSDTLKSDKLLYGKIDQEVHLSDEGINIFVGCKTNKKGGLDYVIYTKDEDGKVNKEPVVDGVKLTPSTYLKSLQTALTWRIDEITSESLTIQKKILLELYRSELSGLGVIFDKSNIKYAESILGRIDKAVNFRSEKEFERKKNGGFANHLEPLGIYLDNSESLPARIDISESEEKKNRLTYDINNIGEVKKQRLEELKNKAGAIVVELKEENSKLKEENKKNISFYEAKHQQYKQNIQTKLGIETDLKTLFDEGCIAEKHFNGINNILADNFKNKNAMAAPEKQLVVFSEDNVCLTTIKEWSDGGNIEKLLKKLDNYKGQYTKINNEPTESTDEFEKQLEIIVGNLSLAKITNEKCDAVDSFIAWRDANQLVMDLRNEYASMLSSIDTGVEGLKINVENDESKLDIYLTYNGFYDKDYFNNKEMEHRKLSSYSGTQKPLICLLIQNYLLSKKSKAMRYLWIDDVPIDIKTKELLNRMGKELGLTIIVNITGDFDKKGLDNGEILIEGGRVFFN